MKEIPLIHGNVALVDDDDFCWISQRKWYLGGGDAEHRYALTLTRECDSAVAPKSQVTIGMHRLIMRAAPRQIVYHLDGNCLNNQRSNLSFDKDKQQRSRTTKCSAKSGVIGVYTNNGKIFSQIQHKGHNFYLGRFATAEEARAAYLNAAGEFRAK